MAQPNSVWQQPVPAVSRASVATQAYDPDEWNDHSEDPELLMVEQQWREAKRLGLLRNHGLSINTDETDAAR